MMRRWLGLLVGFLLLPLVAGAWGVQGVTAGTGSSSSYATPAYVQSNSGYSSGPATLSTNATAGNLLAVWVSGLSTMSSTTLSGGGVSSWTAETMISPTEGNTYGRWFWGITTGGAVSITISNGPDDPGWSIYEISNIDSSSPLDQHAGVETVYDGTWSSGNITTTRVNAALLGAFGDGSADPGVTWGAGWGNTTLQNGHVHGTAFKVGATEGSYDAGGTDTTTGTYGPASIIAFKAKAN